MLRSDDFFSKLNNDIASKSDKSDLIKSYSDTLYKTYDIPRGLSSDYLTLKIPTEDASDFLLYALAIIFFNEKEIQSYFSPQEIKKYSKMKFNKISLDFPLTFDMIQIRSNQWIGKITAQELMRFRDAQIINYNERTQRTLERKITHGHEVYQIAINEAAVKEIETSYEEDAYIPNTITLNIPDIEGTDFSYDSETHKLTIYSLKYFDILDGYHRYHALSKVYTKNHDFDYEMELRIVNFTEDHARHFIWQEDQKTQMSKVDSESYNQNDYSVFIGERVADSMAHGIISRNKGIIDFPEFVIAVKCFYNTAQIKRSEAMKITEEIKGKLDQMIEEDPTIIDVKWKRSFIYCAVCVMKNCNSNLAEQSYMLNDSSKNGIYNKQYWEGHFNMRKAIALSELLKELNKKVRR